MNDDDVVVTLPGNHKFKWNVQKVHFLSKESEHMSNVRLVPNIRELDEMSRIEITDIDTKQFVEENTDICSNRTIFSTQTYIKMRRDRNRKNYGEICSLSAKAEEYFDKELLNGYGNGIRAFFITLLVLGIVAAVIGAFISLIGGMLFAFRGHFNFLPALITIICGVIMIIAAVIIGITVLKRVKKERIEIEAEYNKNKAEADRALEECRRLVNG